MALTSCNNYPAMWVKASAGLWEETNASWRSSVINDPFGESWLLHSERAFER